MENIKFKIFKGASDVKEKFETSQELNELRLELRELQKKRTNYILELGEVAYSSLRKGEEIKLPFVDKIQELDKKIFDLLNEIQEKRGLEDGKICQCGNPLTPEDKFCKECGKKVEDLRKIDADKLIECPTCQTLNLHSNNFCNSCGSKLV